MPAMVIGNGESRSGIDLSQFYSHYTLFGCNAVHRDFNVDHLVCCDKRMVAEAIENPNVTNIYTRERYYHDFRKLQKKKQVHLLPTLPYSGSERSDNPIHWGSGPYAVLLAATMHDHVSLLGFDLYSKNNKVNNCYKGTQNYSHKDSAAVDPSYWIYQIKKIFDSFPNKQFLVYNKDWTVPMEWTQSNVKILSTETLTINTVTI